MHVIHVIPCRSSLVPVFSQKKQGKSAAASEEDENLHDNYIFKPDDEMIELIS